MCDIGFADKSAWSSQQDPSSYRISAVRAASSRFIKHLPGQRQRSGVHIPHHGLAILSSTSIIVIMTVHYGSNCGNFLYRDIVCNTMMISRYRRRWSGFTWKLTMSVFLFLLLISNRGRWSPLSLFRQVHLGVGKSEYNLPSQGYELLQPGKQ